MLIKANNSHLDMSSMSSRNNNSDKTCIHCRNTHNDSNKLTNPPQSRAASPFSSENNKHFPINKVQNIFSAVYQYNNALTPTFVMSHKPSNKKKIIKLQDCTTWLSLSNHQKSTFAPLLGGNGGVSAPSSANPNGVRSNQVYLADAKVFEANAQANAASRINFLLNRKNTRANT
jgi:hypothetical protein